MASPRQTVQVWESRPRRTLYGFSLRERTKEAVKERSQLLSEIFLGCIHGKHSYPRRVPSESFPLVLGRARRGGIGRMRGYGREELDENFQGCVRPE